MKKAITIITLATALSLTACNKDENIGNHEEVTTVETDYWNDGGDVVTEPYETPQTPDTTDFSEVDAFDDGRDFHIQLGQNWEQIDFYGTFAATRGNTSDDGAMLIIMTMSTDEIVGMLGDVKIDDEVFPELLKLSGMSENVVEVVNFDKATVGGLSGARTEMMVEVMGEIVGTIMYMVSDDSGVYMVMYYKIGDVDYTDEFEEMVSTFRAYGISRDWLDSTGA